MLAALVLGVQSFQLPQIAGQLHLHKDQGIAGCSSFHFGGIGSFGLHIVNNALEQIPLAELFNGGRFVLDSLPHSCVISLFCRVIVNGYRKIVWIAFIKNIALPDDTAIPLLQIARTPRRIKMMRGHQTFLHVHARAHFGCGAEQNTNVSGVDIAEQFCLANIRIGIVDESYFIHGDTLIYEFLLHIVID